MHSETDHNDKTTESGYIFPAETAKLIFYTRVECTRRVCLVKLTAVRRDSDEAL